MVQVLKWIESKIKAFAWILMLASSFSLAFILVINVTNITGRYFFNIPLKSTYELTGLSMIFLISLAWPFTTATKGHVAVDIVTLLLPNCVRVALEIFNQLIGLVFFGAMTVGAVMTGIELNKLGQHSDLLQIPFSPFSLLMGSGAFFVFIVIGIQLLSFLGHLRLKEG